MSLQDIYAANYSGGNAGGEAEKTADEKKVEELLAKFNEEECAKLAAAGTMLEAWSLKFETGVEKLAAACNVVDHFNQDDEKTAPAEKTAEGEQEQAKELDAAGRIMAQGFMNELESAEKTASAPEGSFAARLKA